MLRDGLRFRRGRRARRGVLAARLAIALAGAVAPLSAAQACSPWAERIVAWDARADAVVIAIWTERDRPPPAGAALEPEQLELRRISTGAGLATHMCPPQGVAASSPAAAACDWQAAFRRHFAAPPTWRRPGGAAPARIRVRATTRKDGAREFALEARGPRGWARVLWLDLIPKAYEEKRRYRLGPSERVDAELVVALEYHARGGNCPLTAVQVLRVHERDLIEPVHPERRARLVAQARVDKPFSHWRTLAELGPLPPERLIEAMEVAETTGEPGLAARWWREAAESLGDDAQRAALRAELEKHPGLHQTRARLDRGR